MIFCPECLSKTAYIDQLEARSHAERVRAAEMQEKVRLYEEHMIEVLEDLRLRKEALEYGPSRTVAREAGSSLP